MTTPKRDKAKVSAREIARSEAITSLRRDYKVRPGTRIYGIVESVSRSGMSRCMRFFVMGRNPHDKRPMPVSITYPMAQILGWRMRDANGSRCMVVEGCGMDMGFHAVYTLGRYMFPDGGKHPDGVTRDDGGYMLEHRYL